MKKEVRAFLTEVKTLLVKVYGERPEHVHIDSPATLQTYTGHGGDSLGGIRCEAAYPMYDIMLASDFPQVPEGLWCEPINSWSFAVFL